MGKERQRGKIDIPFQENLEECTFKPKILKIRKHRDKSPSTPSLPIPSV